MKKVIFNVFKKNKEFLLFAVSGVIGFIVDVLFTTLLRNMLGIYGARIPAFILAATTTCLFNRTFTFKNKSDKTIFSEYIHYLGLMVIGGIINYIVYSIVITYLKDLALGILLSIALGSIAGLFINFTTSRLFIYKKKGKKYNE